MSETQPSDLATVEQLFNKIQKKQVFPNTEVSAIPEIQAQKIYSEFAEYGAVITSETTPNSQIISHCSFPVLESLSEDEINYRGKPLIQCQVLDFLKSIQEKEWFGSKITSRISYSKDKKTPRIGFMLETTPRFPNTKKEWIKITSDGENIFITKNNDYHRTLKPNDIGVEKSRNKIQAVLKRDGTKRLFGR